MDLVQQVSLKPGEQDVGEILNGDEPSQPAGGVHQGHGPDAMFAQAPADKVGGFIGATDHRLRGHYVAGGGPDVRKQGRQRHAKTLQDVPRLAPDLTLACCDDVLLALQPQ